MSNLADFTRENGSGHLSVHLIFLNLLINSGVGVFFARQDAGLLPAKPDSGNCLAFYCRLFKTFTPTALCPLEAPGRSSCRAKNTPTPQLIR
jgi:hypothetical protein